MPQCPQRVGIWVLLPGLGNEIMIHPKKPPPRNWHPETKHDTSAPELLIYWLRTGPENTRQ